MLRCLLIWEGKNRQMKPKLILSMILLVAALVACTSPGPTATPVVTAVPAAAPTETARAPTAAPSIPTATLPPTAVPTTAPSTAALPLSAPGPYPVGWRSFLFRDAARNNRIVAIDLYYPAVATQGAANGKAIQNAAADASGAPYPVTLGAGKEATYFGIHLASYGIVFAGLEPQDNTPSYGPWLIEYPRDDIFALDQMAAGKLDGFAGVLDPERAGVFGYSFDSNPPLQMSGARIDPAFYQAQCAAVASGQSTLWKAWATGWGICLPAAEWAQVAAVAGESITRSDDGLWQPLADPRVRAVMPMGCDFYWLFGERGLAAVNRPTLILNGSQDVDSPYGLAAEIFRHLPEQYAGMITFVGKDHSTLLLNPADLARMRHFVTAFFGYHLAGRSEYATYFSPESVAQQAGLVWGVFEGE